MSKDIVKKLLPKGICDCNQENVPVNLGKNLNGGLYGGINIEDINSINVVVKRKGKLFSLKTYITCKDSINSKEGKRVYKYEKGIDIEMFNSLAKYGEKHGFKISTINPKSTKIADKIQLSLKSVVKETFLNKEAPPIKKQFVIGFLGASIQTKKMADGKTYITGGYSKNHLDVQNCSISKFTIYSSEKREKIPKSMLRLVGTSTKFALIFGKRNFGINTMEEIVFSEVVSKNAIGCLEIKKDDVLQVVLELHTTFFSIKEEKKYYLLKIWKTVSNEEPVYELEFKVEREKNLPSIGREIKDILVRHDVCGCVQMQAKQRFFEILFGYRDPMWNPKASKSFIEPSIIETETNDDKEEGFNFKKEKGFSVSPKDLKDYLIKNYGQRFGIDSTGEEDLKNRVKRISDLFETTVRKGTEKYTVERYLDIDQMDEKKEIRTFLKELETKLCEIKSWCDKPVFFWNQTDFINMLKGIYIDYTDPDSKKLSDFEDTIISFVKSLDKEEKKRFGQRIISISSFSIKQQRIVISKKWEDLLENFVFSKHEKDNYFVKRRFECVMKHLQDITRADQLFRYISKYSDKIKEKTTNSFKYFFDITKDFTKIDKDNKKLDIKLIDLKKELEKINENYKNKEMEESVKLKSENIQSDIKYLQIIKDCVVSDKKEIGSENDFTVLDTEKISTVFDYIFEYQNKRVDHYERQFDKVGIKTFIRKVMFNSNDILPESNGSKDLKLKLLFSETQQDGWTRFCAKIYDLASKFKKINSVEFGCFHSAIYLQRLQLDWNNKSIVDVKEYNSSGCKFSGDMGSIRVDDKERERFLDVISNFIFEYNQKEYDRELDNCQVFAHNFVLELAKEGFLDKKVWGELNSGEVQDWIENMKFAKTIKREIQFDHGVFQREGLDIIGVGDAEFFYRKKEIKSHPQIVNLVEMFYHTKQWQKFKKSRYYKLLWAFDRSFHQSQSLDMDCFCPFNH